MASEHDLVWDGVVIPSGVEITPLRLGATRPPRPAYRLRRFLPAQATRAMMELEMVVAR